MPPPRDERSRSPAAADAAAAAAEEEKGKEKGEEEEEEKEAEVEDPSAEKAPGFPHPINKEAAMHSSVPPPSPLQVLSTTTVRTTLAVAPRLLVTEKTTK